MNGSGGILCECGAREGEHMHDNMTCPGANRARTFKADPNQRIAYRIFRESGLGEWPVLLYHNHDGSRALALEVWHKANQRIAYNPGKRTKGGKAFRAGFHVFPTLDDLLKYCHTMDHDYAVVQVYVQDVRPKPRSRSTVLLAKKMLVKRRDWESRIPLGAWMHYAKEKGLV
jgi:hypothetical protein